MTELPRMHVFDEPVELTSYDPDWPALYEREVRRIRDALGIATAVEHIGSTAVPGMPLAKPVVDIMAGAERWGLAPHPRRARPSRLSGLR